MKLSVERRIGLALGTVLTSAFLTSCGERNEQNPTQIPSVSATATISYRSSDPLTQIRNIEAAVGNRALTFEEAQDYTTALGNYLWSEDHLTRKPHVYIMREPELATFESFESDTPGYSQLYTFQLKRDYPDAKLPEESLEHLGMGLILNHAWTDYKGNVFMNFFNMSMPYFMNTDSEGRQQWEGLGDSAIWQYMGDGPRAQCLPPTSVAHMRSTTIHELIHAETPAEWEPLERKIIDSFERLHGVPQGAVVDGRKRNFMAEFDVKNQKTGEIGKIGPYNDLNERITDYVAYKLSMRLGFPYKAPYVTPHDVFNFDQVFRQAGLDERDLLRMQRNSDLVGFYDVIGRSLEVADDLSADQLLDGVQQIFPAWRGDFTYWEHRAYKDSFPKIDLTPYDYALLGTNSTKTPQKTPNGCIQ